MPDAFDIESQPDSKKKAYFDDLYPRITEEGRDSFESDQVFEQAVYQCVRLCLSVNDYIHANNLLQCYKEEVRRNRPPWYHYYSMLVYGKRLPEYFLRKPGRLRKKIARYQKIGSTSTLQTALVNLLLFYARLHEHYPGRFTDAIRNFCTYFTEHPFETLPGFKKGIEELEALIDGAIDFEDVTFDVVRGPETLKVEEKKAFEAPSRPEDSDVVYAEDAKVIILGDMQISKHEAQKLAKVHGFDKDRVEIVDYDDVQNFNIHKLRHNENYCGIIFGPIPHSATGAEGDSSLISHVENTDGYPHHVRATARQSQHDLKITKKSLKQALAEIKNHYETMMA